MHPISGVPNTTFQTTTYDPLPYKIDLISGIYTNNFNGWSLDMQMIWFNLRPTVSDIDLCRGIGKFLSRSVDVSAERPAGLPSSGSWNGSNFSRPI